MALIRIGRHAAINVDRVNAIRIEANAATAFFAGETVTFGDDDGSWRRFLDALPEVGLWPDESQGYKVPDPRGSDPGGYGPAG